VETYNAAHPDNPILIDYYEATPDVLIANMTAGVIDATLLTESDVKLLNTFWPVNFKITGDPIGALEESRFVFQKSAGPLRDAVDRALGELKESGELEAIQRKAVDNFFKNAGR
jgi:ABC-type amino acid transport substrate-binding protein